MNLYAYVANDPVNQVDPTGTARICTTVTGSRLQACVGVDADGDGDIRDRDLTNGQISNMASAFHDFIVRNNGADLSGRGAMTVSDGTVSPEDTNYIHAVSQFVGATLARGWGRTTLIATTRVSDDVGERTNSVVERGRVRFEMQVNPRFMDHARNPSSLARSLFHGYGHIMEYETYGHFERDPSHVRHQAVDIFARRRLMRSGLGGGGCPAVGAMLFGWIPPQYPGC